MMRRVISRPFFSTGKKWRKMVGNGEKWSEMAFEE
jgi:hypothetical protein